MVKVNQEKLDKLQAEKEVAQKELKSEKEILKIQREKVRQLEDKIKIINLGISVIEEDDILDSTYQDELPAWK